MRTWFYVACATACCLVGSTAVRADVQLPNVIGSHMVLQRDQALPIWGWAKPDEEVTVQLADQSVMAKADAQGNWQVKLAPLKSGGGPLEMTVRGTNTIKLTDILVGEVWVGSGQSNMQWSVQQAQNSKEEIAAANYPQIRLFNIPLVPSGTPAKDVKATWTECTPQTATRFSAVLYFFGRELHKQLDVPVGLIATSWGGTRIEPWIPPVGFEAFPELSKDVERLKQHEAQYAKLASKFEEETKTWLAKKDEAEKNNQPVPTQPTAPKHPLNSNGVHTGLYNGMIHPIVPFAIRGAIWYQGESNNGMGMQYHHLMKGLIGGWRQVWGQGDFPFLFVQIAPYKYGTAPETNLAALWEAQIATLSVPNTGIAGTNDVGNVSDIHPRNKQEVGRRLSLWALAKTYGKSDLVYSGPLFDSVAIEGDKAIVKFKHTGGGLLSRDDKPLNWFFVAGADKQFHPATATIVGDTVVVTSPQVTQPQHVRFGWSQIAEPNLANKAGLPALPFRSDQWTDAVMNK